MGERGTLHNPLKGIYIYIIGGYRVPHSLIPDSPTVRLPFAETSEEQVHGLLSAAGLGSVAAVEEILQRPQDPNLLDCDTEAYFANS